MPEFGAVNKSQGGPNVDVIYGLPRRYQKRGREGATQNWEEEGPEAGGNRADGGKGGRGGGCKCRGDQEGRRRGCEHNAQQILLH